MAAQKVLMVLLMPFCKWTWARFKLLIRKCSWLSSLQIPFVDGLLIYQAFCAQKPQQNQPDIKKLKRPVLVKYVSWKKQPVFKSYVSLRKKERTSEIANCFLLQKRRYILCWKTLFTTKHKTLKRQKGNIWKRWIVTFFFCWSNSFLFFSEEINSGVKKKEKISTVGRKM